MGTIGRRNGNTPFDVYDKPEIDGRYGNVDNTSDINKPVSTAQQAALDTKAAISYVDNKPSGFKNLLVNGGFDIWQRGTSFTNAGTGYTADRFKNTNYGGATPTITKVAGTGNFNNALRITNIDNSSGQAVELDTTIEGGNLPNSGYLTISFYIRGNKNGIVRTGRIVNGSIAATNSGYGDVNVTTSWTKVTKTVTAIAADDSQFYRVFILDGSFNTYMNSLTDWVEITGVQLEEGPVATPFEQRPYGLELSLCQRYYESVQPTADTVVTATGTTTAYGAHQSFKVEKRVPFAGIPAISTTGLRLAGGLTGTVNSITYYASGTTNFTFYVSGTFNEINGTGVLYGVYPAAGFDAEIY